jgi:hypothetical protein
VWVGGEPVEGAGEAGHHSPSSLLSPLGVEQGQQGSLHGLQGLGGRGSAHVRQRGAVESLVHLIMRDKGGRSLME